jgi:alpha-L-rhamnosidase
MPTVAAPTGVRFEHHADAPTVVGCPRPRISWVVPQAGPEYRQRAYSVRVIRDAATREFEVDSAEQILVPWPDSPLASRERAEVRVRVRDDAWSGWSEPATVEAGLLAAPDWAARMVSPRTLGGLDTPAPVVRGELDVPGEVARARLYATAHGIYLAQLNGRRVGDQVLAPGWTSYPHRLRYQTYDVTELVRSGSNVLEVLLGNGWYRGRLGFAGGRALYGDRLGLLAQLEVTTVDGRRHLLATDGSWTARRSAILADDLYDGQRTDLRHRADEPDDAVDVLDTDLARLVAPDGPPVRVTDTVPAQRVFTAPSGATLVDFGQNVVGWVRVRVPGGASGDEVVVRHAEVLDGGELGVRPLRTARATDSYLLAGEPAVLEPSLTFHGFRYAEITGVPGLREQDVHAVVIGTDLRRTGWFECSHPLLNRFHENVVWSARGNFLDVPTDCPQRDERLGWTGDIQVFAPSACFLFDTAGFLTSWLADLAAEQHDDGSVPFVVPDVLRRKGQAAAAWGDAAVLVPWVVYQHTGDLGLLERQLPSMRAWVDHIARLAGQNRLWEGGFQFGDWLDPAAPPSDPFAAKADPDVVATAYLARSTQVVADAADLLGDESAARYAELARQVRAAFHREYVTGAGRVLGDAPTSYALALAFALLSPGEQRDRAGRRLADLVRGAGFRTSTGFVGTPLIMDALTEAGQREVAYRLLLQTGCPSWLYPVTMGATTVWERWDSLLPDGSLNPGEMTSFNHYALGAVADWLHRTLAGLAPARPGYRELTVAPRPGPGLSFASARHRTPYGEAEVSWRRTGTELTVRAVVPVGSTATVHLPGAGAPLRVGHGRHEWRVPDPATAAAPDAPTLRDVLDHEPTWVRVAEAAADAGVVRDERQAAARLARDLDAPAGRLADVLAVDGFAARADDLRRVLDPLIQHQFPVQPTEA